MGGDGRIKYSQDGINRSTFLLGGFALENLIKCFLVYENPDWIANGHLKKQLRNHKLTELAGLSRKLPYRVRGKTTLNVFENGLNSWARYPCGLHVGDLSKELTSNEILWSGYLKTVHAYASKAMKLLSKKWYGPHGFTAKYEFSGNAFFSLPGEVGDNHRLQRSP